MNNRANAISAGVDLGVRTLATISVFEDDSEISRQVFRFSVFCIIE